MSAIGSAADGAATTGGLNVPSTARREDLGGAVDHHDVARPDVCHDLGPLSVGVCRRAGRCSAEISSPRTLTIACPSFSRSLRTVWASRYGTGNVSRGTGRQVAHEFQGVGFVAGNRVPDDDPDGGFLLERSDSHRPSSGAAARLSLVRAQCQASPSSGRWYSVRCRCACGGRGLPHGPGREPRGDPARPVIQSRASLSSGRGVGPGVRLVRLRQWLRRNYDGNRCLRAVPEPVGPPGPLRQRGPARQLRHDAGQVEVGAGLEALRGDDDIDARHCRRC